MAIEFQMPKNQNSIIKVIGVGGGGGNAVNNMYQKGIKGVDFLVCNTDIQALDMSPVPNKIRLGTNQTEGLGAGANPEVGRIAAVESIEEVREILKSGTKMVFITAGMGGGTGTGGAPVIAGLAKEMGILTVGIVTTPFKFEGRKRMRQALEGIRELENSVDTMLVISNDNLTHIFGQNVTMKKAFEEADTVLCDAAKGIAEIITLEGYINVDFADVQTIMKDGGTALMGSACYEGEDRAIRAAEEAINSPMLDNVNIYGSKGILVNITAAEDSLRLDETTTIIEYVQDSAGDDADIIFGTVYNNEMGEKLSVTVIATGFDKDKRTFETESVVRKTLDDVREEFSISAQDTRNELHIEDIAPVELNLFAGNDTEPEPAPKDDQNQRILEERIKKLRSTDYDYHNPSSLRELETTPAWQRKNRSVDEPEDAISRESKQVSRMSLDEIIENRYELNDNNPFLHDNVD